MLYQKVGSINTWKKFSRNYFSDKTLLVIGTGRIGSLVVELINPFLKVTIFDLIDNKLSELNN